MRRLITRLLTRASEPRRPEELRPRESSMFATKTPPKRCLNEAAHNAAPLAGVCKPVTAAIASAADSRDRANDTA